MDILDLLREKGIKPCRVSTTKGGEYHSPCPGCGGQDRFHVWPAQNNGRGSWWCRGCGKGGDAIQFLREFCGMSFRDACYRLGLQDKITSGPRRSSWKASPVLPRQPEKKSLEPREEVPVADPWQRQAEKLLQTAEAALHDDPAALDHLKKTRGITPATARRFRLGLLRFPGGKNCRFSSRKKWGLQPKEGGKKPDALWIPRGLVIPAFAADGSLVRLRIRRPDSDRQEAGGPKYYILPGSAAGALFIPSDKPALVVVEAELDAFLLAQVAGDLVGVVAMGSSAPRPTAGIHEILKEANLILLAFDADEAGLAAVEKWRAWYSHAYPCPIPGGHKDPGEAFQAGEDLRRWIEKELPAAWRTSGKERTESRADKTPLPPPPARASLIAGVPVLASLKSHDGGDPFCLVRSVKEKMALAKIGRVAFLPHEVEMSARLPPEMLRSFLDFSRVFPGSELVEFRRTGNPGGKPRT